MEQLRGEALKFHKPGEQAGQNPGEDKILIVTLKARVESLGLQRSPQACSGPGR